MRYYDIALFIFIFNLVLGFLFTALSPYTDYRADELDYFGMSAVEEGEQKIAQQVSDVYTPVWSELNWLVENVRLVVQGVSVFITTLSKATILFPLLWYELSAPYVGNSGTWALFVGLFSTPFYFIYFMAVLQWATGRSAKDVQ